MAGLALDPTHEYHVGSLGAMTTLQPIMFVRYTPGACGNFLITMLQLSDQIAHWDPEIQQRKGSSEFHQCALDWVHTRFTENNPEHLKFEPHHPYALDFFSAKHPRGDDIAPARFIELLRERKDQWFELWVQQGLTNVLRLNKSRVPDFGIGSVVVNIRADDQSRAWLNRCRAVKLFGKEHGRWISKENHPEFLRAKFSRLQFHNQYQWDMSDYAFIRNHIIQDPTVTLMSDPQHTLAHASNGQCRQLWIDLSDMLDHSRFVASLTRLYAELGLTGMDQDLVEHCYQHYWITNIRPFLWHHRRG